MKHMRRPRQACLSWVLSCLTIVAMFNAVVGKEVNMLALCVCKNGRKHTWTQTNNFSAFELCPISSDSNRRSVHAQVCARRATPLGILGTPCRLVMPECRERTNLILETTLTCQTFICRLPTWHVDVLWKNKRLTTWIETCLRFGNKLRHVSLHSNV